MIAAKFYFDSLLVVSGSNTSAPIPARLFTTSNASDFLLHKLHADPAYFAGAFGAHNLCVVRPADKIVLI